MPITQKKTSYAWNYDYAPSGPASVRPHAPIHIGERTYTYDANGNQTGWDNDDNGTRRTIAWDEENRIQSIKDNGHEKSYWYDDAGERVIKRGPQGETVYVNQWYSIRDRSIATKHVFVGSSRIASRLVGGSASGGTPSSAPQNTLAILGRGVLNRAAAANLHAQNTVRNPHYATITALTGTLPTRDNFLYYYHPDHLGSTSHVTDAEGKLYEHIEYFPFGESWVEESSNTQRTPYLFTGKELDEETGLYYFGARYYDARTGVWQSADPAVEKYLPVGSGRDRRLPGLGGVFNPRNLGVYSYAGLNPLRYTDPTGRWFGIDDVVTGPVDEIIVVGGLAIAAAAGSQWAQNNLDKIKGVFSSSSGSDESKAVAEAQTLVESVSTPASPPPEDPEGGWDQKSTIPQVENKKLQNYVKDFYKGTNNPNRIGSGTTADAVRYETATGQPVGGRFHTQKAQDMVRGLENWLKKMRAPRHRIER